MYSIVQLAVCTRMIEVYYYWGKFDHRDLKCAFVLEAFENCKTKRIHESTQKLSCDKPAHHIISELGL